MHIDQLAIQRAIQTGLKVLSADDVTVPASSIDDLATLKLLFGALLRGELALKDGPAMKHVGAPMPDLEPEDHQEEKTD